MEREHLRTAIIGGCIFGLATVGLSVKMNSAGGWMLLGLGLLPPLLFLRVWHQPPQMLLDGMRGVITARIVTHGTG